jgi:(p)ppGpp synthase/HD superfamily hydrolase
MTTLVTRAAEFARTAHAGQVRRYTGEPYFNHAAAVAHLVAASGADEATIAAAFLHDTLEDTATTFNELLAAFGLEVATLVLEVTDVASHGDRAARAALARAHLAKASARAKTIKLADVIDNTGSIAERDPEFAKVYLAEKRALLEVLGGGSPALFALAKANL